LKAKVEAFILLVFWQGQLPMWLGNIGLGIMGLEKKGYLVFGIYLYHPTGKQRRFDRGGV
jgi:hypothetical protein